MYYLIANVMASKVHTKQGNFLPPFRTHRILQNYLAAQGKKHYNEEACLGPCVIFMMEFFAQIVNGF